MMLVLHGTLTEREDRGGCGTFPLQSPKFWNLQKEGEARSRGGRNRAHVTVGRYASEAGGKVGRGVYGEMGACVKEQQECLREEHSLRRAVTSMNTLSKTLVKTIWDIYY